MSNDVHHEEEQIAKPDDDDLILHSVTSIMKAVGGNEGLIYWSAEEAAKCAVRVAKSLPARIEEDGEEATILWLRDARFRPEKGTRSATQLGTDCHHAFHSYVLTGQRPQVDAELVPFLDAFDRWCQEFQPAYEAAEMTVYSPRYGYAGTLDAIMKVGDTRLVVDYKTTKKARDNKGELKGPYPEVALQLAAYRHAELAAVWRPRRYEKFRRRYYLLGPDEQAQAVPVPEVDGGLVLHVTPEACVAYPVQCDDVVFRCFLFAVEAYRWVHQVQPGVLGQPLEPAPVGVSA